MITLSKRMHAIADMVSEGGIVADVGCDHGYLPITLVREGISPSAVALDVRPGPLSRAKAHIEEYGLASEIESRLSDGLSGLSAGECDTLVIAGMGGPLIEKILGNDPVKAQSFKEMILGPQSDVPHFRRWLFENGYFIIDEAMVCEEGKYYTLIKTADRYPGERNDCADMFLRKDTEESASQKALSAGVTSERLFDEELSIYCGSVLLDRRDTVLKEYLLWRKRICDQILINLKNADNEAAAARRAEIDDEKRIIEQALSYYEQ